MRQLVIAAAMAFVFAATGDARSQAATGETLAQINAYFNSIQTMRGEFVQFGPDGSRTSGRFAIQKPGKVRFFYDRPSSLDIISDGGSVAVRDRRSQTQDIWPLKRTPLRFLLDDQIDLTSNENVKRVDVQPDLVSITIEENTVFGDGSITLLFDAQTKALKQWNVVDSKGQETSVSIYNVKTDVEVDQDLFVINYRKRIQ
ncbi:MAG: outer-membrane lipoprotein carrier protein LolA [Pseudomonadota bacterium]